MQTILLVDDDAGVRGSVGDMLKRSGYDVLVAEDGNSALDALQKNSAVDLVIADRKMPGMDGLTLVRRIKERTPGLPMVIMTGYGDLESYLCATSLGVMRYIGKPVGLRELLQTVRDAVDEGLCAGTPEEVRTEKQ
jgi:two-component system response regulator (stage 0 sporulation protein F)